ncbi:MAG: hypothetical protein AB7K09_21275 [Planctomycetota bacterium]
MKMFILMILAAFGAMASAMYRVIGLTGFRQVLNDARGLPAQTRYTRSRQR